MENGKIHGQSSSVHWIFSYYLESKMKHPIQRKRFQAKNYQLPKNGLRFVGNVAPMNEMLKVMKDENDETENSRKNYILIIIKKEQHFFCYLPVTHHQQQCSKSSNATNVTRDSVISKTYCVTNVVKCIGVIFASNHSHDFIT